jgi:PIN domain nuclease of toxin-antitoxin system
MLLLDTCSLLWLVSDTNRLSATARSRMTDPNCVFHVSAFSAHEIGFLVKRNRIVIGVGASTWFATVIFVYSLRVLPVTWEIALGATQLPPIHNDPADRLIIATAIAHGLPIVSPDRHFPSYPGITVIW